MFLAFALLTLAGGLGLLLSKNVVIAALFMVLSFLGLAGLYLLLANPVAAALQVIVYSGAIMVLVLFVIMLLNSHQEESPTSNRPVQRWLGLGAVLTLGVGAALLVWNSPLLATLDVARPVDPMTLQKLGRNLFSQHLVGFEAAGLLLLAAMIGAVTLVKREL